MSSNRIDSINIQVNGRSDTVTINFAVPLGSAITGQYLPYGY